jgi:hypothetical protein
VSPDTLRACFVVVVRLAVGAPRIEPDIPMVPRGVPAELRRYADARPSIDRASTEDKEIRKWTK